MGALIDYIFHHERYKQISQAYKAATNQYDFALKVWLSVQNVSTLSNRYKRKAFICDNMNDIILLDNCIQTSNQLISSMSVAVKWLYYKKNGKAEIPTLNYEEYIYISNQKQTIYGLNDHLVVYNRLMKERHEATCRFINKKCGFTFEDIERIASSEDAILKFNLKLVNIKKQMKQHPVAWNLFASGRSIDEIPVDELEKLDDTKMRIKETFIELSNARPILTKLVLGENVHPISSFDDSVIENEQYFIHYIKNQDKELLSERSFSVSLENPEELKKAILDSLHYGDDVRFAESFTISDFYKLREESDKLNLNFDEIIRKAISNKNAIKAYNYEKHGKSVIYIENYIASSKVNDPVYNYIESYNEQKPLRDKAKRIAESYQLGFKSIFDNPIDCDTCGMSIIETIINNEVKIKTIDNDEKIKEKKRRIKKNLIESVSRWDTLFSGLKYTYLFYYYPTTCEFEATQEEWDNRRIVWNFKNDPERISASAHTNTLNKVITMIKNKLTSTFTEESLKYLTFVCIPASSQAKTKARYEEFSSRICEELGMINAYPHITVTEERLERHLGGTNTDTNKMSFDNDFFKGKYVLLFDDVITRGNSMNTFKRKMESLGATVVGGLCLGKTKHERPDDKLYDELWGD